MIRRNQGIAIVIVLIISAVALLTVLFASATLSIASRSAVSSDRNSTQALLAADSGLKTLKARASTVPYEASYNTFENWIESNFAFLDMGDDVTATISVVNETADRVTVQAVGAVGPFQRTLVQEFMIVVGPPLPLSATVPGALTSVGSIKSNSGSARVLGRPNTDEAWTTNQIPVISGSSTTYQQALLCDAIVGEYVELSGVVYRVASDPDCTGNMDLVPVLGGPSVQFAGSQPAAIRVTAITETLPPPIGNPPTSEINVTPGTTSLFGVGSPISIGGESMGKVVARDGNRLTIEWTVAPGFQAEGTIVRREIVSGVTMGDCPTGQNVQYSFPNGCAGNVDLKNLFYKTFGVISPDFLYDSLPATHKLTGSQATDGRILSDITWVTDPANNFRDQRGSGVLIIEAKADQTINLNVSNDFVGLIYVIGNAKIQGNAQYHGAIIVDGTAEVDTSVQGTTNIYYDPMHLVRALADIKVPNPNPGGLGQAVENTWRIR